MDQNILRESGTELGRIEQDAYAYIWLNLPRKKCVNLDSFPNKDVILEGR